MFPRATVFYVLLFLGVGQDDTVRASELLIEFKLRNCWTVLAASNGLDKKPAGWGWSIDYILSSRDVRFVTKVTGDHPNKPFSHEQSKHSNNQPSVKYGMTLVAVGPGHADLVGWVQGEIREPVVQGVSKETRTVQINHVDHDVDIRLTHRASLEKGASWDDFFAGRSVRLMFEEGIHPEHFAVVNLLHPDGLASTQSQNLVQVFRGLFGQVGLFLGEPTRRSEPESSNSYTVRADPEKLTLVGEGGVSTVVVPFVSR